jgi:hypothetical protein
MSDAVSTALSRPAPTAAVTAGERDGPISWRLAAPLIGGASVALWAVVAEVVRAALT